MSKLTMHELCKRIDAEFDDVDLSIHNSPTKGTVAVVYFYENKMRDIIEPKMINVNLEYEGEDLYSHFAVHGFMFHDLERILVACAEKKAWEYANNLNDYK